MRHMRSNAHTIIPVLALLLAAGVATGCGRVQEGEKDSSTESFGSTEENPTGTSADTGAETEPVYSEGLAFTLKDDGTYEVSGIGSCEDEQLVIPSVYWHCRTL